MSAIPYVDEMQLRHLKTILQLILDGHPSPEGRCVICGCDDEHACQDTDIGNCWWIIEQVLCSACIERAIDALQPGPPAADMVTQAKKEREIATVVAAVFHKHLARVLPCAEKVLALYDGSINDNYLLALTQVSEAQAALHNCPTAVEEVYIDAQLGRKSSDVLMQAREVLAGGVYTGEGFFALRDAVVNAIDAALDPAERS